jgi:hypothetical protein
VRLCWLLLRLGLSLRPSIHIHSRAAPPRLLINHISPPPPHPQSPPHPPPINDLKSLIKQRAKEKMVMEHLVVSKLKQGGARKSRLEQSTLDDILR